MTVRPMSSEASTTDNAGMRLAEYAGAPSDAAARMMAELKAAATDAVDRYIRDLPLDDAPAIIKALGGSFRTDREYDAQGGHRTTILVGRNKREACIYSTKGRVTSIKLYEARS